MSATAASSTPLPPEQAWPALVVDSARVAIDSKEIVSHAELVVGHGELVAVVGPNGAGKSTLVRAAAGIQKLSGGMARCMGVDVTKARGRHLAALRAFVPQRPSVPEGITVNEALQIGRSARISALRRATKRDRDAISASLERAGVTHLSSRMLTTLSGGELQRVQIAIGLAQGTPLLIADEPTSQLDLGATVTVARLLRDLADDGMSVLLVVHDLALAAAVADTVVVMSRGASVASGAPDQVLTEQQLAEVWGVSARLDHSAEATALRVRWLDQLEGWEGTP